MDKLPRDSDLNHFKLLSLLSHAALKIRRIQKAGWVAELDIAPYLEGVRLKSSRPLLARCLYNTGKYRPY